MDRVLAEDVVAKEFVPFWDNSAVDGYAVKSAEVRNATNRKPCSLKVVGSIFAGDFPKKKVRSGTALKIMTGAPVPEGADAIVMQEDIKVQSPKSKVQSRNSAFVPRSSVRGEVRIEVLKPVRKWENVRRKGEDIARGKTVLKSGTLLSPPAIGLCACLGYPKLRVIPKPAVAILSTGNELSPSGKRLRLGQIRESNSWILKGLAESSGAEAAVLGIVQDDVSELKKSLTRAFLKADLVISSGGVSVGEADFVRKVLKKIGAKILLWKIAMKPGKPLLFAIFKGRPFFGLPGNPVSSYVTFQLFVRPALLKMAGKVPNPLPQLYAQLDAPLKIESNRRSFLRGKVFRKSKNRFLVKVLFGQGSHQLYRLAEANSLLDVPAGRIHYPKGKSVSLFLLDNSIALC